MTYPDIAPVPSDEEGVGAILYLNTALPGSVVIDVETARARWAAMRDTDKITIVFIARKVSEAMADPNRDGRPRI